MAARRLQRYANFLNAFRYTIKYVKSSENCADGLSRLIKTDEKDKVEKLEFTHLNFRENESQTCLDWKVVAKETRNDKTLSKIFRFVKEGWPKQNN